MPEFSTVRSRVSVDALTRFVRRLLSVAWRKVCPWHTSVECPSYEAYLGTNRRRPPAASRHRFGSAVRRHALPAEVSTEVLQAEPIADETVTTGSDGGRWMM